MDKHPINDLMKNVMESIHGMVDVSTVVGDTITTPDGITIIPISKVSFGFASGGSDFTGKHQQANGENPFGGGCGAGVKIDPLAFVVVKEGNVRVMTIEPPATTTVDRIVEMAPDIIEKIRDLIEKNSKNKNEQ